MLISGPRLDEPLRFALINDEWTPTLGGISTFNREVATALAAAGHRTLCLVPTATRRELEDAEARGVMLATAEYTPEGANWYVPTRAVIDFAPHVVIGHDRISGSVAETYATRYLPVVPALVYIFHTAPPQIEPYKDRTGAAKRVEERERVTRLIAERAYLVAAVGASLTRYTEAVVGDGFGGVSVLQLDPGMTVPGDGTVPRQPCSIPTVLVLGRTGDIQLKGLDLAAKAVAGLTQRHGQPRPILRVRGAPAAECDELHSQLVALSALARDRIDVRPFTDEPDLLHHEHRRTAVFVLPSRAEGFGLSALEAIGQGTPVLVSDRSGLAELLRDRLGRNAEPMIVETLDHEAKDVAAWTRAIRRVLDDLPTAFQFAHDVRRKLIYELTWDAMVSTLIARLTSPATARVSVVSR